ncbi:MAG: hypothetical protein IPK17_13980 [Chloroflexi bacterium]|uniref:hypothetical protein n=1 Tax=Candidatus Flexifilum breve TaxID=3140694 RepID=UPI00313731E8|nr:hypothetical protein [Chloroflexota bacterium]
MAMKPSVVYVAGGQRIEEKGDQTTWMILEQTHETEKSNQVNAVVAGYLGQGQLGGLDPRHD